MNAFVQAVRSAEGEWRDGAVRCACHTLPPQHNLDARCVLRPWLALLL